MAIATKRDVRTYAARPLPAEAVERILQAGRVAGSARNRQQYRFDVLATEAARSRAASGVTRPSNLHGAAIAIAIVLEGEGGFAMFDVGRAAQNMMLAATNDGIGSCPNSPRDDELFRRLLGLRTDERVGVVLSFGYSARGRRLEQLAAEEWLARAERKPLEQLVRRL